METIKIVESNAYDLSVSKEKNRVFLKIKGMWRDKQYVPNYHADLKKALSYTKPDFTLLTDASEMIIHPKEMRIVHEEAQQMFVKAGVRKVAEVQKNIFTESQLNGLAKATNFPKKSFSDKVEAEIWLEEK